MEMSTTERIDKPCAECGRTYAEAGRGECGLCHAVLLGKAVVARWWTQSEFPQFIGLIVEVLFKLINISTPSENDTKN